MEDLKKEAIVNFVCKNYSEKIPKKMVKYFLKRSIGPSKDGLIAVLDQGEFLTINEKGNIIGPS